MGALIVSGDFMTGPSTHPVPATFVTLSVSTADGLPVLLDLEQAPVKLWIALNTAILEYVPLRIVDVFSQNVPPGFYIFEVDGGDEWGRPEDLGVASMAAVVEHGGDRGQALFCCCGVAGVYERKSPVAHAPGAEH